MLKHIAGKTNAAADALSRPPGVEQGKKDNQEITMLDPKMFICLLQPGDPGMTESVTALAPLVIPEQPEGEWFNASAKTPAMATPLETLNWLYTPDSPSLGKHVYDSDTGPASPVYGLAEHDELTGLDGPTAGPTDPSGSNGRDDPEDREAKKQRIRTVIMTEAHQRIGSLIMAEDNRCRSIGIPDWMTPEEYEACDDCAETLEEYWQPEDECHDMT